MSDWPSLLREREPLDDWFTSIAERLLNGSRLLVGRQSYRLVEIEFYYWSAAHPDPFAHRDPIQFHTGLWYFHRTRGVYRSGSFKGLDLTFGHDDASGGILIRGLKTSDGTLIDGPSLCVDHLLHATGAATVAELDRAINKRLVWEEGNPLYLDMRNTPEKETHEILDQYFNSFTTRKKRLIMQTLGQANFDFLRECHRFIRSPRVGLSLKKVTSRKEATRFIMRPYRYLAEPTRTKKGKLHMVLALHAQGVDTGLIQFKTNRPRRTVERYIADFERGRKEADFAPYFGIDLGPAELCKLYGVWFANWGFSGEMR